VGRAAITAGAARRRPRQPTRPRPAESGSHLQRYGGGIAPHRAGQKLSLGEYQPTAPRHTQSSVFRDLRWSPSIQRDRGGSDVGRASGRHGRYRSTRLRSWEMLEPTWPLRRSSPIGSSPGWVILRSRCCCQMAAAICTCPGPVGRWSFGSIPLAARHTSTSPMMPTFGRLPCVSQMRGLLSRVARPRI
jgi:hypothetical protein